MSSADTQYITVYSTVTGVHTPVLVAQNPNGFRQVSDRLDDELDYDEARLAALRWAKTLSLPFKV